MGLSPRPATIARAERSQFGNPDILRNEPNFEVIPRNLREQTQFFDDRAAWKEWDRHAGYREPVPVSTPNEANSGTRPFCETNPISKVRQECRTHNCANEPNLTPRRASDTASS